MLDPWIIEEIRRREEEERAERERGPQLEIPMEAPVHRRHDEEEKQDGNRGVVIVDFTI